MLIPVMTDRNDYTAKAWPLGGTFLRIVLLHDWSLGRRFACYHHPEDSKQTGRAGNCRESPTGDRWTSTWQSSRYWWNSFRSDQSRQSLLLQYFNDCYAAVGLRSRFHNNMKIIIRLTIRETAMTAKTSETFRCSAFLERCLLEFCQGFVFRQEEFFLNRSAGFRINRSSIDVLFSERKMRKKISGTKPANALCICRPHQTFDYVGCSGSWRQSAIPSKLLTCLSRVIPIWQQMSERRGHQAKGAPSEAFPIPRSSKLSQAFHLSEGTHLHLRTEWLENYGQKTIFN